MEMRYDCRDRDRREREGMRYIILWRLTVRNGEGDGRRCITYRTHILSSFSDYCVAFQVLRSRRMILGGFFLDCSVGLGFGCVHRYQYCRIARGGCVGGVIDGGKDVEGGSEVGTMFM